MFTYLHTAPSLISLMVSVDVKHHVYLLHTAHSPTALSELCQNWLQQLSRLNMLSGSEPLVHSIYHPASLCEGSKNRVPLTAQSTCPSGFCPQFSAQATCPSGFCPQLTAHCPPVPLGFVHTLCSERMEPLKPDLGSRMLH